MDTYRFQGSISGLAAGHVKIPYLDTKKSEIGAKALFRASQLARFQNPNLDTYGQSHISYPKTRDEQHQTGRVLLWSMRMLLITIYTVQHVKEARR